MDTTTAILITQFPITIGILIAAYELYKTKKVMLKLLEKLTDEASKHQKKP